METFYILGGVIGFGFLLFFSVYFKNVALEKGHSGKKYFWICFLFGIFGMLMVAALPDHNLEKRLLKKVKEEMNAEKEEITSSKTKEEPKGFALPQKTEAFLKEAYYKKTETGKIICLQCKFEQPVGRTVCWHCGVSFKEGKGENKKVD